MFHLYFEEPHFWLEISLNTRLHCECYIKMSALMSCQKSICVNEALDPTLGYIASFLRGLNSHWPLLDFV